MYDPDDPDADPNTGLVEVQLGTEDTTEGISQDTANTLYYQLINNLEEINTGSEEQIATKRTAAQTNLDVAPSEEIIQINARLQDEIENIDPFSHLPHASAYSYNLDATVSGANGVFASSGNDFYNSLGLSLVFAGDVSSVQTGDIFYIFTGGDSSTGTPQLVLRRNSVTATTLQTRTRLSFTVVDGFSWLEQYLAQPSFPGSSTRDADLTSTAASDAFGSFYTRSTMANRASFIRVPADGGQPTLVHAAQSVPSTGTGQDEIVSGFAIRAGFNALEDQISDSWPPVGGFAVEHLGNGVINFGGQSSWSNATEAPVFGVGGIRYSLSNGFRATG